ncbi:MAG: TrkH family potassium uptake protein [Promicromonosporaceae bacterium]|nr:TrkH family potassium uptake protein [Promicromonosporaceae bacterium]
MAKVSALPWRGPRQPGGEGGAGTSGILREFIERQARRSPARLAVVAFAGVCALFTLLLLAPWAKAGPGTASFTEALFTAVSAVSITGLTVVETGTFWTTWGLVVILIAIKVGGFGVMTLASILALAVSRRLGLTQRLLAASETKTDRLGEVGSLIRVVLVTTTSLELIVALMVLPRLLSLGDSVGTALWHSLFYGISAFNNAGFVPTAGGLAPHAGDWLLGLPLVIGVFVGALGFPVIRNIIRTRRRRRPAWRRWSLHTKLTIVTSASLLLLGWVVILALEWTNPGTFGPLGVSETLMAGLHSSVMPRSGGLTTVDVGSMHSSTRLVTDALMFVGGGSASTGGGIKVTTLAVMLLAIRAESRGDKDVEAYGRRISRETVRVAIAVVFLAASVILVGTLTLLEVASVDLDAALFEVLSAFSTVGLSTGITPYLPTAGRLVLVVLMFVGRAGIMTFAAALALRQRRRIVRLPEDRPLIG